MNGQTKKFLRICLKHGIKKVAIRINDDRVKSCLDWPFDYESNVFADGEKDGWPIIWEVVKEHFGEMRCGNSGQAHIGCRTVLEPGYYQYRNSEWVLSKAKAKAKAKVKTPQAVR
jgi:hypothetical protein